MLCPECSSIKNSVIDSRLTDNNSAIRRRRQCDSCNSRFTTFERLRSANLMVKKRDQTLEEYDREKLERGIWHACGKRPVDKSQIVSMLNSLEEKWAQQSDINTAQIGDDVMAALKEVDAVAHIRFASVFKAFEDAESFQELIQKMEA